MATPAARLASLATAVPPHVLHQDALMTRAAKLLPDYDAEALERMLPVYENAGPAIVSEMGYGHTTSVTAVGDTVNTASRLEAITKDYGAELVISETAAQCACIDLTGFPVHDLVVRGRRGTIYAYVIEDAQSLPALAQTGVS